MHGIYPDPVKPPASVPALDHLATVERGIAALSRRAMLQRLHAFLNARGPDLERPLYATLTWLADRGPARVSDMAEALAVDASTMSRLADRLVTAGLASAGPDPRDGRAVLITASAAGQAILATLQTVRVQAMAEICAGWPPEDLAAFARLLERFVAGVETVARNPAAPAAPGVPA